MDINSNTTLVNVKFPSIPNSSKRTRIQIQHLLMLNEIHCPYLLQNP